MNQRKYNKSLIFLFISLIYLESLSAQGINLSLWKNIATQRTDSVGSTFLNIGFFSAMNQLNGLGINVVGATVEKGVNGFQLAGLANVNKGNLKGLQVAGITHISSGNLTGVSLAGLIGIAGNNVRGIMASGWINVSGENSYGLLIGGLVNLSGKESAGMQWGGLANAVGKNFTGVQLAGLLNVADENMKGVQLAALGNIASENASLLQLALCNIAVRSKGLQIGLVNYYREDLNGFQLGLVNANPQTRVQLMMFGGNGTKINVAARFKNKVYYTILGVGAPYLKFHDKFSSAFFYRAGAELPLCKWLFLSGDLGYSHIELYKNRENDYPHRLYALQTRLNLEYRPINLFGLFLSGGYGWDRRYKHHSEYDKGVICEAGIVLF